MNKKKKRNIRMKRRILHHRLSIFSICIVIAVLAVTLSVASISLHKKYEKGKEQETVLNKQLDEQEEWAEEIGELEKHVGSKEYNEDVARDKWGLAYPNETLFEAEP